MELERSLESITCDDLRELYAGSVERLHRYFIHGQGTKWSVLYDIDKPIAVALCQGAAMHFHDHVTGIRDFDIWFFYPFKQKHLPYRTIWNWDYMNPKFGRHPNIQGYKGRKVDVIVRSVRNYTLDNPVKTICQYLKLENTASSRELAKKAVVMLFPTPLLGQVVWYKQEI